MVYLVPYMKKTLAATYWPIYLELKRTWRTKPTFSQQYKKNHSSLGICSWNFSMEFHNMSRNFHRFSQILSYSRCSYLGYHIKKFSFSWTFSLIFPRFSLRFICFTRVSRFHHHLWLQPGWGGWVLPPAHDAGQGPSTSKYRSTTRRVEKRLPDGEVAPRAPRGIVGVGEGEI